LIASCAAAAEVAVMSGVFVLSVVAQQLVQLAVDVLREAVTTSVDPDTGGGGISDGPGDAGGGGATVISGESPCSRSLVYTARSMFEMFASLVPIYHHNVLSTVPQLAG